MLGRGLFQAGEAVSPSAGYVAMFLALGLGTTAAKTSFFGSLQAVVCAGGQSTSP